MDKFWAEAAKILKPGGTVAIWTRGGCFESLCYLQALISLQLPFSVVSFPQLSSYSEVNETPRSIYA